MTNLQVEFEESATEVLLLKCDFCSDMFTQDLMGHYSSHDSEGGIIEESDLCDSCAEKSI